MDKLLCAVRKPGRTQDGFTLVEVLIALIIIAVALSAIIGTVSSMVRNYSTLQEKTFAHWVAMNKMTEIQVMHQWPATRTSRGSMMLAEQEWFWEMDVKKTEDKTVRKVEIKVRLKEDDENAITYLVGFIGRPT